MKLAKAKDIILKHLINAESIYDLSSSRIKYELKMEHYLVIAALLELQEIKFIDLTGTSVTGSGKMSSYMVQKINAPAYHFCKTKSFQQQEFWSRVKEFIKSYWVVIALGVTVFFNVRAIVKEKALQGENQLLRQQLQLIKDSLHSLKSN